MKHDESLEIFGRAGLIPDEKACWELYEKGIAFNNAENIYEKVRMNENFYIGNQWEGVDSNGLPTPVFNYLKRVVGFIVASITTDRIKVMATMLAAAGIGNTRDSENILKAVNDEFERITEQNNIPSLTREFARNAAVDGDGCIYTYWDPTFHTGIYNNGSDVEVMGRIRKEIIENTRVLFGNENDRDVQSQPYIIISKRELARTVRKRAKKNGFENWGNIYPDSEESGSEDSAKRTDDKVTVLLLLWKTEEDIELNGEKVPAGTVCEYEFTQVCGVTKPHSLEISMYPIQWLNWDYIQDSYHGQSMVTGLIPNQIFINRTWAMVQLSTMKSAFSKVIYDKSRIARWDNRVGSAIGINGGDVSSVAKIIDPAPISPQISQLIELAVSMSQQMLGATDVALGDTRPDNTSAIIALQRSAQTPHELTKQNLYSAIEDGYRIDMEFMAAKYGTRLINLLPTEDVERVNAFLGEDTPVEVLMPFDFSVLKMHPMTIKLDVGASTYYSETASTSTLDNLLTNGHILLSEYLERLPNDFLTDREGLLQSALEREKMQGLHGQPQQPMLPPGMEGPPMEGEGLDMLTEGGDVAQQTEQRVELRGGSGNGSLQRAIAKSGTVPQEIL